MSDIVVSAAACRTSGTLTIYKQFLSHLPDHIGANRYYIFVDETMPAPRIGGVDSIFVDVRGWVKRIVFDFWECEKYVRYMGCNPSLVISLQNTGLRPFRKGRQMIYYHQPLPLFPERWNPFKRRERMLFFYKTFYPAFVRSSFAQDRVRFIAQIPFIKEGIIKRFGVPQDRVDVQFPDTETTSFSVEAPCESDGLYHFFYPAIGVEYKRHATLVRAMKYFRYLNPDLSRLVRFHFTLAKNYSAPWTEEIERDGMSENFVFHGTIPHEQLMVQMAKSRGLLFPSTIESLGLPLLEAASLGLPIVASDLDYVHQVLGSYEGVSYVGAYDYEGWANCIAQLCNDHRISYPPLVAQTTSSWDDFFKMIDGEIII